MIRETQEETAISDLVIKDGFEDEISYRFKHDGNIIYKRVVFYLASTKTERVVISDEHIDYVEWAMPWKNSLMITRALFCSVQTKNYPLLARMVFATFAGSEEFMMLLPTMRYLCSSFTRCKDPLPLSSYSWRIY